MYGVDIAAVELHALYDFAVGLSGLGLLNGDNAVCGDLFHSLCDQSADLRSSPEEIAAYAGDVAGAVDVLGILSDQLSTAAVDSLLDAAAA